MTKKDKRSSGSLMTLVAIHRALFPEWSPTVNFTCPLYVGVAQCQSKNVLLLGSQTQ
jgi:hypothetical protein